MGVNTVTHWVNIQKRGLEFSAPSLDLIHTLGTRGFPCMRREFSAIGGSHKRRSAGHYKDLTETGNRARKASGTQGTLEVAHETESLLGRIGLWETLSTLLWLLLLLSRVGKLGQNSFQKQSHSALRQKTARVSPAASK